MLLKLLAQGSEESFTHLRLLDFYEILVGAVFARLVRETLSLCSFFDKVVCLSQSSCLLYLRKYSR